MCFRFVKSCSCVIFGFFILMRSRQRKSIFRRFWCAFWNFCARIFGALEPFWVPFGGPVGSRGGPKIQLLGTKSAQEAPKWCSGGGSRKGSEIERKQGPKMSDFWEARTSKIVLPCRRRAYFAKTGRRGNCHEKGPK